MGAHSSTSTILDAALGYIARGWAPVPIKYRRKYPEGADWPNLRITAETAPQYFNGARQNIGVLTGEPSNGLADVDLDCAEAIAVAPYFLPPTGAVFGRATAPAAHWLYTAAGAGNRHEFRDPELAEDRSMLVELRGNKHQTVFPGSAHQDTGEAIEWERGLDAEPAAADAADLLKRVRRLAAAALLARTFPGVGGRDDYCLMLGGFLNRAGLSEGEARTFIEAVARAGGSDAPAERARKGATVREAAHLAGFPKLAEWIGDKRAKKVAEWLDYKDAAAQAAAPAPNVGGAELVKNRRGFPVWCAENACLILEHAPIWQGVLAYDEFDTRTLLLKPIPGSRTPLATFKPREMTEADVTQAVRWFNRNGFPDATKNASVDALLLVARQTIISPVRHYLEDLKWDGHARIELWLRDYCGAKDTTFVREAGRAWLISAAARALQPGCKADCALILEGRQGVGKSTALRTLAGPDWFFDGIRDFAHKDSSSGLRGKWIIELPELAALRRSDVEAVKAFLSRTEERYRPAYGRTEVYEPRRCVFAGTTNRSDYVSDDTGARRFWPVAVEQIDVAALERDRDQLWAEAVTAYRAGLSWWLTGATEIEAAQEVALRSEDDPWAAFIMGNVASKSEVSTYDLLDALGINRANMTKADNMRVGGVLARNGWRSAGRFTSGPNRGATRYVPGGGC